MNISKNLVILMGLLALVALSYFGLGAYNKESTAQAQDNNASGWQTNTAVDLTSEQAKLGYTIGAQIGADLRQGGMQEEIEVNALVQAIKDMLAGGEPQLTSEEMLAAQQAFQLKRQQEYAELAAKNLADGEAFLEQNKTADGIVTTDSGLQYQVVREGKGANPTVSDTVKIHYLGSLLDGTPFDSSYQRNEPVEFPVSAVIPGFSEGLQLMNEGAKYRFVLPSNLAYGERGTEAIGPNSVLVFEVELLEILPPEAEASAAPDAEADSE